jgi:hypothetical protein
MFYDPVAILFGLSCLSLGCKYLIPSENIAELYKDEQFRLSMQGAWNSRHVAHYGSLTCFAY